MRIDDIDDTDTEYLGPRATEADVRGFRHHAHLAKEMYHLSDEEAIETVLHNNMEDRYPPWQVRPTHPDYQRLRYKQPPLRMADNPTLTPSSHGPMPSTGIANPSTNREHALAQLDAAIAAVYAAGNRPDLVAARRKLDDAYVAYTRADLESAKAELARSRQSTGHNPSVAISHLATLAVLGLIAYGLVNKG